MFESAVGASAILRSTFLKAQSLYLLVKSYLPGRAGKSEKLPARDKICLPRAGGQAVVSNADHTLAHIVAIATTT